MPQKQEHPHDQKKPKKEEAAEPEKKKESDEDLLDFSDLRKAKEKVVQQYQQVGQTGGQ